MTMDVLPQPCLLENFGLNVVVVLVADACVAVMGSTTTVIELTSVNGNGNSTIAATATEANGETPSEDVTTPRSDTQLMPSADAVASDGESKTTPATGE